MELRSIKDLPDELFDHHHNLTDEIYLQLLSDYKDHSPEHLLMAVGSVYAIMISDFLIKKEEAMDYARAAGQALENNVTSYLSALEKNQD